MRDLIDGVARFQSRVYPSHRELFEHLAHGQSPEALFISCADSRVDPSLLTQSPPGRLFIMRNAGNLVPVYDGEGSGEAATLAYAIDKLEVHHIIVCGHSDCGAVTAVLTGDATGVIADWLEHAGDLDDVVEANWPELRGADKVAAAVFLNTHRQLAALRTHPCVQRAEAAGRLTLHAWVYDIGTGEVHAYDPRSNGYRPLNEVDQEQALIHELEVAEPPVEEGWIDHGPWSVFLATTGRMPEAVVDALEEITGWDAPAVEELLASLPAEILHGLTRTEAEVVRAWLGDAGAVVELRSGG